MKRCPECGNVTRWKNHKQNYRECSLCGWKENA
jgi:predicted RNA-binding Zn-ribbon protein involved in translation (DUF1610 family)